MQPDTPVTRRVDHVSVVVNSASRSGAALPVVEAALRRTGAGSVEVFPAAGGHDLPAALAAALVSAPDLLVVGGGDGTAGARPTSWPTRAPCSVCCLLAPPTTSPVRSRSPRRSRRRSTRS